MHDGAALLRPGGELLFSRLSECKQRGLASKVGASVYDEAETLQLASRFPLDLIQLPLNVFDQRALASGALAALKERGVEVHARSIFLQGLLLMAEDELPDRLRPYAPRLRAYRDCLREAGYSPLEGALGFIKRVPGVDIALIGVTSDAQLRDCVAAYERGCDLDLQRFACSDAALIDPRRWSRQ